MRLFRKKSCFDGCKEWVKVDEETIYCKKLKMEIDREIAEERKCC